MTIIIVLGNVHRRYVSSHDFFSQRAHLGYAAIAEEAISYLPDDVQASLIPIDIEPFVIIFQAGST